MVLNPLPSIQNLLSSFWITSAKGKCLEYLPSSLTLHNTAGKILNSYTDIQKRLMNTRGREEGEDGTNGENNMEAHALPYVK